MPVRTVRTTDHIAPKRVGYRLRDFAVAVYQLNLRWIGKQHLAVGSSTEAKQRRIVGKERRMGSGHY